MYRNGCQNMHMKSTNQTHRGLRQNQKHTKNQIGIQILADLLKGLSLYQVIPICLV